MHKTVVINAVGLTPKLLARMPLTRKLGTPATIGHVMPAVTSSVQATYLTGTLPSDHGIVGNGWYFRDECEIRFWHQSDKLVQRPRIWDIARQRDPSFTCANICWWNAMYSSADQTVTPRPMYPANGRKIPDLWTHPEPLRNLLQKTFGQFPLFKFWGPMASIESSQWIAGVSHFFEQATLKLIYLPHLDYDLQRYGPDDPRIETALREFDELLNGLIQGHARYARVIVLSEYGIEAVNQPVHINRILRQHGLIAIREELGRELLDAGASAAFAVADHQIAHVYVNDQARLGAVESLLRSSPGIDRVLNRQDQQEAGIDHSRSGELVAIASPGAWFTYYHWLADEKAPDFARTVDIHRKPGYDPVELFIDPKLTLPKLRIAWTLLKKKLGFASLLNLISLDASLMGGSHGREPSNEQNAPVFLTSHAPLAQAGRIDPTDVRDLILSHVFD